MGKKISKGMFESLRAAYEAHPVQIARELEMERKRREAEVETERQRRELAEAARRRAEQEAAAERDGAEARRHGLTTARCPHAPGHALREAWMRGWRAENAKAKGRKAA